LNINYLVTENNCTRTKIYAEIMGYASIKINND
jgi:hypothetical protein